MVNKELRERSVQVYLPSRDLKDDWKEAADEQGLSLSEWVQEAVRTYLKRYHEGETESAFSRLQKDLDDAEDRVAQLEQRLREKDALVEKLEKDLQTYRDEAYADAPRPGHRRYDRRLVEFLRSHRDTDGEQKTATEEQILRRLDVDDDDAETVQTVATQLRQLKSLGAVETTPRGWRWIA